MADYVSKAKLARFWQGIKTKLANKSDVGHDHSTTDLTSGVLSVERGGTGYSSVDTTPTNGSAKMVTSGGIYTALTNKAGKDEATTSAAGLMSASDKAKLDGLKNPTLVTAAFDGLGWNSLDDGTYQQTLSFAGVTADSLIIVKPAAFYDTVWAQMGCRATEQGAGTVTFVCNDPQDVAMTVEVIILN